MTPPQSGVEHGVEYLEARGGAGWSISGPEISSAPPQSGVERGVEYLDRRGGAGWSFHPVQKRPMNTPIQKCIFPFLYSLKLVQKTKSRSLTFRNHIYPS